MSDRPQRPEPDVQREAHEARSRATGGVEDPDAPDQHSTTGTTPNDEFVGRVAGTDAGYEGETGAERRSRVAAAEPESPGDS
ncbi:MAG TPA: hypothetical protein VKV25_10245 [Acidimicrobiales bacterium]|nr:hypothetical protein [Acidimicrobiales bacterium]